MQATEETKVTAADVSTTSREQETETLRELSALELSLVGGGSGAIIFA